MLLKAVCLSFFLNIRSSFRTYYATKPLLFLFQTSYVCTIFNSKFHLPVPSIIFMLVQSHILTPFPSPKWPLGMCTSTSTKYFFAPPDGAGIDLASSATLSGDPELHSLHLLRFLEPRISLAHRYSCEQTKNHLFPSRRFSEVFSFY